MMTDDEKKYGYRGEGDQSLGIFNFEPQITQGLAPLEVYNMWDPLLWALYLTLETAIDNVTEADIKRSRGVYYIDNRQLLHRWKIIEYLIKAEPEYFLLPLIDEYWNMVGHVSKEVHPQISDQENWDWSELDSKHDILIAVYHFIEKRIKNIFRTRIDKEERLMNHLATIRARYTSSSQGTTLPSSHGTTLSSSPIRRLLPFSQMSTPSPILPFGTPPRSRPRTRIDGVSRTRSRSRPRTRIDGVSRTR